jgi:hypothetical protein
MPPAGIAYYLAEEILVHPHCATARTAFVDAVLALYEGDAFLTQRRMKAPAHAGIVLYGRACRKERLAGSAPRWRPDPGSISIDVNQFTSICCASSHVDSRDSRGSSCNVRTRNLI